ncbi:putative basic amino acid antiporter YfcC [Pseudoalteromonas ruthenica]|uniref:putative basic amino acid antiporter YfcC n=1 Tax=Pseudoalteromonas ruthenica TaxID=151081 RepID=UPI000697336D|nr:putative basic amino acid antiporter YfcC [Pseudoalteromonas ruthenica]TMO87416.1 hypothetical protein CWC12_11915 [Pseudoalteromonas ruthenica]TMO94223.1 hypothetical protein CWC13_02310 [Pseudoalteromonas ruthenica]TMP01308.1 hypothetical protein CWC07_03045 [Pseudoalteromonas ruthenica]TMP09462.1 hypothetical protein CWC08_08445 [Pseudoalteromonas ruthenica]TMP11333.1 hypothetical protein CWC09_01790 [Pseudoalteromonas ruthenica]
MTNHTRFSLPSASVILMSVALLAYASTWFVQPGWFAMDAKQTTVSLAQFQQQQTQLQLPLFASNGEVGFVNVLFEGLVAGDKFGATIGVMAFILITGGAFSVLMHTGAINRAVLALIGRTQKLQWLFIPVLFTLFSLGGAIFGMGEEAIAFCVVLLPIMKQLGYNAQTTVLVTYVATQIGFASSWMNPFSIAIAQSIAELGVFSGAPLRMFAWGCFTLLGMTYTYRYAKHSRALPAEPAPSTSYAPLCRADKTLLLLFAGVIAWVIWGVTLHQYYIPQLAGQFFTLAVLSAIVAKFMYRTSFSRSAEMFTQGAQELLPAALLVALAKGIVLLLGGNELSEPSVLNTLLYYSATLLYGMPEALAAWSMLVFQSLFNFFVSSGSGQAAITMPIMAPLGDLLNVGRQTVVLAFQLGDGLTNIIIPTSASLIGCLGVVKLEWGQWFLFIWRLQLALFALASAFVIGAQFMQYS